MSIEQNTISNSLMGLWWAEEDKVSSFGIFIEIKLSHTKESSLIWDQCPGLCDAVCEWSFSFLTSIPQRVRIGDLGVWWGCFKHWMTTRLHPLFESFVLSLHVWLRCLFPKQFYCEICWWHHYHWTNTLKQWITLQIRGIQFSQVEQEQQIRST